MNIIFIFLLCGILQFFLPWWSLAIGALSIGFLKTKTSGVAFTEGFIGVSLLWLIVAFFQYQQGAELIAQRVSKLFSLPSPILLIGISGIIGGIVGGFAALTGHELQRVVKGEKA